MNEIIEMQYNFLLYTSNTRDVRGDIFKIIVAIPEQDDTVNDTVVDTVVDTVNDTVNDAVNDAVKFRLIDEIKTIIQMGNIRLPDIIKSFGIERAQAQRDMKLLKEIGFVEFQGSPKTGGYYLTEKMKKIIK